MQTHPRLSLIEHFKEIPDPRVTGRCDHDLIDVLVIALCTLLCGGENFNDMEEFGHAKQEWFKTFLCLRNGIPRHDTFNRVFAAIKPEAFLDCFLRWTQQLRQTIEQEIVALDGKALRRALAQNQSTCYIVNAWACENGLALGQRKVDDKSNEITAVPELLRVLELAGCIVTLDAMGCQKNIAKEISEADADYVLALKGNQGTAHEEIKSFLDDAVKPSGDQRPQKPELAFKETVEKDHGRHETRRYWQTEQISWFAGRSEWEELRSIGLVESVRQVGSAEPTIERRYYISSLKMNVETFARAVRSHWQIENCLHWVLDVQCGEDDSRARTGHAAENLATLRRFGLNVLKQEKTKKRSIRTKQLVASWDHSFLLRLLTF
jgi:predicted transposase YbfD/YdcC